MTTFIYRQKRPLILWGMVTLFFAFQFILRLITGILREDIIQRFQVDTVAFGTLAGYYYLGYAGMQIPLGFMLDRYNFRFVTFIAIITSAIGTLTFSYATIWEYVLLGRFLIGAGTAVAFLAVAKVTKSFFHEKYHSLMIGFAFTFGLTGAVIGGKPTKIIFDSYGYDNTLQALAAIAIIIGLLIMLINDKKIEKFEYEQERNVTIKQTFKLLFNPTILFIGLCGGLMVGSLEGFADLWAIPFFAQIYKYSEYDSIMAASIIYTGMCFGGPILAWLADKFKSNMLMILLTGILMSGVFMILFTQHHIEYHYLVAMMFIMGILCCYQVLVFTQVTQLVSKSWAGLSIAIINCINMSFGHFFHKVISNLMQNYWTGEYNEKHVPIYDLQTYIMGLSPIPICSLLGALGFLYLSTLQKRGKLKLIE